MNDVKLRIRYCDIAIMISLQTFHSFLFFILALFASQGGLEQQVDEKILFGAFVPFGDIAMLEIPKDAMTKKHRGFAFIEFIEPVCFVLFCFVLFCFVLFCFVLFLN